MCLICVKYSSTLDDIYGMEIKWRYGVRQKIHKLLNVQGWIDQIAYDDDEHMSIYEQANEECTRVTKTSTVDGERNNKCSFSLPCLVYYDNNLTHSYTTNSDVQQDLICSKGTIQMMKLYSSF